MRSINVYLDIPNNDRQWNEHDVTKLESTGLLRITHLSVSSVSLSMNFLSWYLLSSLPRFIRKPCMLPDKYD